MATFYLYDSKGNEVVTYPTEDLIDYLNGEAVSCETLRNVADNNILLKTNSSIEEINNCISKLEQYIHLQLFLVLSDQYPYANEVLYRNGEALGVSK